jgi:hypothetical protein
MTHSALFRTFANLSLTEEGVRAFANEFGSLLGGEEQTLVRAPGKTTNERYEGEPLWFWCEQALKMRELLAVWEQAELGNFEQVKKQFQLRERGVVFVSHPDEAPSGTETGEPKLFSNELIAPREYAPELVEEFKQGHLGSVAKHYVRGAVDARLRKCPSQARLQWNIDRTEMSMRFVPGSLIAALWLQFGLALAGSKKYRECANCSRWFEVSGGTTRGSARKDRKYCSDTCKSRASRQKRQAAVSFKEKGLSVKTTVTLSRWSSGTRVT